MHKKFLILSLFCGLAFTSCQQDNIDEEIQTENLSVMDGDSKSDINTKIHEPDWLIGPGAQIHEPDWLNGPVLNIHEPDWMVGITLDCGDDYDGSKSLVITRNNSAAYRSAEDTRVELKNLNIGGELNFCGLLLVENTVNIHRAGVFDFAGEMFIGTEEKPADLVITSGAHLNFAGKIYVTGDLIIEKGAEVHAGLASEIIVAGDTYISES